MEIRPVKFRAGGEWRVGGLYSPGQRGPGVLMLHGFPGVQQNEDLAAELCRRGMTVLLPHYRGCWGSPGRFHVGTMFSDAAAARLDHPEDYVHRIAPTPVLFAHGMRDRLVPPESTRRLWALARAPKEWKGFPGEDHEFQNDRPAVVNAVCGWLEERLARPPVETLESLETADVGGES